VVIQSGTFLNGPFLVSHAFDPELTYSRLSTAQPLLFPKTTSMRMCTQSIPSVLLGAWLIPLLAFSQLLLVSSHF